jgi:hypothetical protein
LINVGAAREFQPILAQPKSGGSMRIFRLSVSVALGAALLAACSGGSSSTSTMATSTARGTLELNPPLRIASLDAATLGAEIGATATGAQLLQLTGTPTCGVDFYYVKFWTVGGANEVTESSGALMVPTGAAPACSGPRPIVEYAHGTAVDKTTNLADVTNPNNTEGVLIAATFAAQGYIVVAPNYAGYDISTLGYHPYLNAVQNANEMIDMLAAARTALPKSMSAATSDNGMLFLTGYSEGGYVAMATQRAMIAAGTPVTAVAPMSGPYALEAFADSIFFGGVDLGSTVFTPLLTTSYQKAYGNIYSATTDVYSATYATGIETLLPSTTPIATIFANGLLPLTALFDNVTPTVTIPNDPVLSAELTAALAMPSNVLNPLTPLFDLGFGASYLVNNSYRVSYAINAASFVDGAGPLAPPGSPPLVAQLPTTAPAALLPAFNLRQAFNLNDLRNPVWAPNSPTLLCGGGADPTVFFSVNTGTMQSYWSALPAGLVTVLDINGTPAGSFAPLQTAFQASQAALLAYYESAAGGSMSASAAQSAIVAQTHAAEAPFCTVAARAFFTILGG